MFVSDQNESFQFQKEAFSFGVFSESMGVFLCLRERERERELSLVSSSELFERKKEPLYKVFIGFSSEFSERL